MTGHLEKGFGPLQLDELDADRQGAANAHLASCDACADEFRASAEALTLVATALPPIAPHPDLWQRVLERISCASRFGEFAERAAQLLDLGVGEVRDLLARIDEPASWSEIGFPGVSLFRLKGGPAVEGAIVGLFKIRPFADFPEHVHRGDEQVLVLQGSCWDSNGTTARRGDLVRMSAKTGHVITALAGPELILLAVAQGGIDLQGSPILPGDPPF